MIKIDVTRLCNRCFVATLFCLTIPFIAVQVAEADPIGTSYTPLFDGFLLGGDVEGHFNNVTFDGLPDLLANDLVPLPPNLPGNDLIVSEVIVFNPDGSETVSIWIQGQDPFEEFPMPGAPIFANPLGPTPVDFRILSLSWGGNEPVNPTDFEVLLTFGAAGIPTEPESVITSGDGTLADPLDIYVDLASDDFTHPLYGDATDLHFSFTIDHGLLGDITGDGTVDIADFTLWADNFGNTGIGLPADVTGDGEVDIADFTLWADNFGNELGAGGGVGANQVPEPSSLALFAVGIFALAACGWRWQSRGAKSRRGWRR